MVPPLCAGLEGPSVLLVDKLLQLSAMSRLSHLLLLHSTGQLGLRDMLRCLSFSQGRPAAPQLPLGPAVRGLLRGQGLLGLCDRLLKGCALLAIRAGVKYVQSQG